jgi:hypothetical protein
MKGGLSILGAIVLFSSCTHDKVNTPSPNNSSCDTTNVSYSTTIKPIISNNCSISGCHDDITKASGYDMSDYVGLKQAVQGGRIVGAIEHLPYYSPMPNTGGQLSQCQIENIVAWINQGIQNN